MCNGIIVLYATLSTVYLLAPQQPNSSIPQNSLILSREVVRLRLWQQGPPLTTLLRGGRDTSNQCHTITYSHHQDFSSTERRLYSQEPSADLRLPTADRTDFPSKEQGSQASLSSAFIASRFNGTSQVNPNCNLPRAYAKIQDSGICLGDLYRSFSAASKLLQSSCFCSLLALLKPSPT